MQLTVLREEQGVLSRLLFTTPVQSSKFMHTVDCLVLPCVYQIKYSSEFVEFIAILIIFSHAKVKLNCMESVQYHIITSVVHSSDHRDSSAHR